MNGDFLSRREFLKALGATAALGLGRRVSMGQARARGRRPNFVFFLIDDLGWADLGCYGSSFYETPHLDRLAGSAVRFTDAYTSCPV